MPQLSPLNWLISFFLITIFSLSLASIFWWRQSLVFPLPKKSTTLSTMNKTWHW